MYCRRKFFIYYWKLATSLLCYLETVLPYYHSTSTSVMWLFFEYPEFNTIRSVLKKKAPYL